MASESKTEGGKASRYCPAPRLKFSGVPTVWQEFSPLASELGAVNLGQGFPNWESPDFVKQAAVKAINDNYNQYCRSAGHVPLVKALAARYSKKLGREINAMTEVTVSVGASEGLFAVIHSLVGEGDGVLMFSPAFDIYIDQVNIAGGEPQYCPLRVVANEDGTKRWSLDVEEFAASIQSNTRVLVLNTPHNPTGKVFTLEELTAISKVLEAHPDIVVVADEVYENMVFAPHKHVHFASLPGMFDRSISVSSAGKTFSVTGWKIGFVVGPAHLIKGVVHMNQAVQFSVASCLQQAIADALDEADKPYNGFTNFYEYLTDLYAGKRTKLLTSLRAAGLDPIAPEGSFFIMADTSKFTVPEKYLDQTTEAAPVMHRDWAFCRYLAYEHGVVAIPPSAFYSAKNKHLAANLARFAFCKTDDALEDADRRLRKVGESLAAPAVASKDAAAAAADDDDAE